MRTLLFLAALSTACTQEIGEDATGTGTQALTADGGSPDLFCAECFEETAGGFGLAPGGGGSAGSAPEGPADEVRVSGPPRGRIASPGPAREVVVGRDREPGVGVGAGGREGVELPTVHHVPCPVMGPPCMAMCSALGAPCVGASAGFGTLGLLRSCGAGVGLTYACEYDFPLVGQTCTTVYVKPFGWTASPTICGAKGKT